MSVFISNCSLLQMDRESPSHVHEAVTDCLCSALYIVEVSTLVSFLFQFKKLQLKLKSYPKVCVRPAKIFFLFEKPHLKLHHAALTKVWRVHVVTKPVFKYSRFFCCSVSLFCKKYSLTIKKWFQQHPNLGVLNWWS